eukprot:NODE_249_length_12946_cov_0.357438.p3 type:complete len:400 gc:universal NODE_249_length_12946_cov_0.357438:204-1403(+)
MTLPLPIEIFEKIFSYLDNVEMTAVRLLNRALNRQALNKMFFQVNLYGTYDEITFKIQRISEMVDRYKCQGIRHLAIASSEFQFNGQKQFLNTIFHSLMGMKLHKLMLMHPNTITKDQLQLLLLTHPLKELECHFFELDEEITWILLKYGSSLTNISLELPDKGMNLLQVIPKLSVTLQNLSHLDLHNGYLTVHEIKNLFSSFKIKALNLNQMVISGSDSKLTFHCLDLLRIDDCAINSSTFYDLFNPEKLVIRKSSITCCQFDKMSNLRILSLHELNFLSSHCVDLSKSNVHKIRIGHSTLVPGGLSLLLHNKNLKYFEADYIFCTDFISSQLLLNLNLLCYFRLGAVEPSMFSLSDVYQFYTLKSTIVISSKAFLETADLVQEWCSSQDIPQHVLIS